MKLTIDTKHTMIGKKEGIYKDGKLVSSSSTMDTKKLREEYEKKFYFVGCGLCCENTWLEGKDAAKVIWSWIETAISKARREERERILRWHNLEKNKWSCVAQDEGQECCIDKLLTQKEK